MCLCDRPKWFQSCKLQKAKRYKRIMISILIIIMIILHVMKITVTIMMTIKLLIMVVVVMMIKIELFLTARHGQLFTSFSLLRVGLKD